MSVIAGHRAGIVIEDMDYSEYSKVLSEFQIEKLTYFFKQFFDNNQDGVVDKEDFDGLNERLRKVGGWDLDDPDYLAMVDNNRVFLECLLEQVKHEKDTAGLENRTWEEAFKPSKIKVTSVSLGAWLNMWGGILKGAAGAGDFPIWVQMLPKMMFNMMVARNKAGTITRECLKHFYSSFTGLQGSELEKIATEGWRTMSANGDYEIDMENYDLLFSNFLLGRTIYGPGKYIFGAFDNSDINETYKIIYE